MKKEKAVLNNWGRYPKNWPPHPYEEFEGSGLWRAVKKALSDLEKNQDLVLAERHEYVVGYICKQVVKTEHMKNRTAKSRPTKRLSGSRVKRAPAQR
jgi:hypothetical protein